MGFELCYLPDMPAVLRVLAGAEKSIEKWWQQLEAAKKHPEGSFKVVKRAGDGGQLRSRSRAVPRHTVARDVRLLRSYRGTMGKLDAARPCHRDRNPGRQPATAEGALHRLR